MQEFEGRTTNFLLLLLITPSTWVITMEAMIDLVVEGY